MSAERAREIARRVKGQLANHPRSQSVRITRSEAEALVAELLDRRTTNAEWVSVWQLVPGDVVNLDAAVGEDPNAAGVWREVRSVTAPEVVGGWRYTVVAVDANDDEASFDPLGARGLWRHQRAGKP